LTATEYVAEALAPTRTVVAPTNFAAAPVRWMRTVTLASTTWPVRLTTWPPSVPALAPAFSELTDPTVTPDAASAGLAPSPANTSATPAARTIKPFIDPPWTPSGMQPLT
jgi:hypothetical protein